MDLGLSDKTAIITGGGSNIGLAISLGFCEEGTNVIIAEIDEIQGQKIANQITAKGGNSVFIKADVTDLQSAKDMIRKSIEKFGRVDILVNNVGGTSRRLFMEKPIEEWEKEIKLNYWSVLNCTRAIIDHMVEQKYGKIINIASDAGRVGDANATIYSGCKGGVIAFTKAIALELARFGINVNAVSPTTIIPKNLEEEVGQQSCWSTPDAQHYLTDELQAKLVKLFPLKRLGRADDVANVVLFLASDKSSFITGETIGVSGGSVMV
jgi:NAD(P)-dependent dehydrogenase (short-subunit alcohol dehydrogenase family)